MHAGQWLCQVLFFFYCVADLFFGCLQGHFRVLFSLRRQCIGDSCNVATTRDWIRGKEYIRCDNKVARKARKVIKYLITVCGKSSRPSVQGHEAGTNSEECIIVELICYAVTYALHSEEHNRKSITVFIPTKYEASVREMTAFDILLWFHVLLTSLLTSIKCRSWIDILLFRAGKADAAGEEDSRFIQSCSMRKGTWHLGPATAAPTSSVKPALTGWKLASKCFLRARLKLTLHPITFPAPKKSSSIKVNNHKGKKNEFQFA